MSINSSDAVSPRRDVISATGRVTRVGAKFAYLTSNHYGGVFVPPQSALPLNCSIPDMNIYLKPGDIVHFTAHAQSPGRAKNSCAWIADRVTVSSQNTVYEAPPDDMEHVVSDKLGCIHSTSETFAFIWSDQYGRIFFPGSAYTCKPGEPPRLNAIFKQGDVVMFCARSQPEMNGSRWLALSVAKVDDPKRQISEETPDPLPLPIPTEEIEVEIISDLSKAVQGIGEVMMITAYFALIRSDRLGTVYCPILCWAGPDMGEDSSTLEHVLKEGDLLNFVAIPQKAKMGCTWRAIKFNPACLDDIQTSGQEVIVESVAKMVCDTAVQTHTSNAQYVMRALKNDPEIMELLKDRKPALGRYVFDEE